MEAFCETTTPKGIVCFLQEIYFHFLRTFMCAIFNFPTLEPYHPRPPCKANLLSNPLIIFGHIFLLVKIVLKGSSGLHFDQNHCSSVNWPVPNHGNFGPLEKGAFWLKTHCCHLVLLDKHCLGLIPCLVCQRHHPPY